MIKDGGRDDGHPVRQDNHIKRGTVEREPRFKFGQNWEVFSRNNLNEARIQSSLDRLRQFMMVDNLKGRSFLDIGCGSGLSSLAAYRLGARPVISFDFDPDSVRTCRRVRDQFACAAESDWMIYQNSILNESIIHQIPPADVVYAWGVLHHSGNMWLGIKNAAMLLKQGGLFYLAVYCKTKMCGVWKQIKRCYTMSPQPIQELMTLSYAGMVVLRYVAGLQNPIQQIRNYSSDRGMSWYVDCRDWVGGYPYESAAPDEVFCFLRDLGLRLRNLSAPGRGLGLLGSQCDEFLFEKPAP